MRKFIEDAVNRLFTDMVTHALIQEAEAGKWPEDLWRAVEESGLTRPHVPEDAGGAGGSWSESYVIARAVGRYTVPLPLTETILASWLLARAGIDLPEGPLTIFPDLVEPGAVRDGKLRCRALRVPWGGSAPRAVFVTPHQGVAHVGLIENGAARITPGETIAREPRDDLEFEGSPIVELSPTPLPPNVIQLCGAMIRSAQMAGALQSLLEQAVRYAGERIQFGRPIAKFQAIQQELARLAGHAAASGVAAEVAFQAADRASAGPGEWRDQSDPSFEIAVAKVRLGEAADMAPGIAHQVLGAIGFTYEHDLHFATRRLWSWRSEFGSENHWADLLGRKAIELGPDGLWPFVTSR